MGLYFEFPFEWWFLLGIIFGLYFLIFILRKSYKDKRGIKAQLICGVITLFIAFVIEFLAVTLGIWKYFPGNWPVTLWIAYFGSGLLSYQLVKSVEEYINH